MEDQADPSRRQIVGRAAVDLAAVAASGPALAQQKHAPGASTSVTPAGYPKRPFQKQRQPWVGLTSRMTCRPDHGETSYKGTGRLNGRCALITGGDSGIGRAAAIVLSKEGADVAICYLPTEQPDADEVAQPIRALGRVLGHEGIGTEPITGAIEAYKAFDERQPKWIKVELEPPA